MAAGGFLDLKEMESRRFDVGIVQRMLVQRYKGVMWAESRGFSS
jgi:hypothetical protein